MTSFCYVAIEIYPATVPSEQYNWIR